MIKLFEVNEQNYWSDILSLSVSEEQKKFLDRPVGIMARGYIYRSCNVKIWGISNDGQTIGIALVKDMDEEPACYDLQQFMIDWRFQNRGCGTEALRQILSLLSAERKYNQVEACVHKDNTAALQLYKAIGFEDTGYIDENVPDCCNLRYCFKEETPFWSDAIISDFSDLLFQTAFKQYFSELGYHIKDWDGLFREINEEGDNAALVRIAENGEIIGFIQFKPIKFTSWFFKETCGFIREFWIAEKFRNKRHGTALIRLAERHFTEKGIYTSLLTTHTAPQFYERLGYIKAFGCKAKNQYDVFIKHLS